MPHRLGLDPASPIAAGVALVSVVAAEVQDLNPTIEQVGMGAILYVVIKELVALVKWLVQRRDVQKAAEEGGAPAAAGATMPPDQAERFVRLTEANNQHIKELRSDTRETNACIRELTRAIREAPPCPLTTLDGLQRVAGFLADRSGWRRGASDQT